jgi:hypothetical protein
MGAMAGEFSGACEALQGSGRLQKPLYAVTAVVAGHGLGSSARRPGVFIHCICPIQQSSPYEEICAGNGRNWGRRAGQE